MNKTEISALVLLVLVLGILLVREHVVAREGEAILASVSGERDDLRARVAQLETERAALQSRIASLDAPDANARGTMRRGPMPAKFVTAGVPKGDLPGPMAALDSPEMRRLMAIEQKGRLDARYAALFKMLGLPPAQLDQLKGLLVDKQNAAMDVLAAARKQSLVGPDSRAEVQALMQQANQSVESAIHDLLGDAAYQQYKQYDQTRAERALVDQLNSRLSYTDAPLTAEQSQDLLDLLSASQPASVPANVGEVRQVKFAVASADGDAAVSYSTAPTTTIADEAVAAAENILSPAQLDALREIQAEQQAKQQMSELMRNTLPLPPGKVGGVHIIVPSGSAAAGG